MKFGVVVFPGSNCDEDVFEVFSSYLGMETIKLWHKDEDLKGLELGDCIILTWNFSQSFFLSNFSQVLLYTFIGKLEID